jgi:hypothetical protein
MTSQEDREIEEVLKGVKVTAASQGASLQKLVAPPKENPEPKFAIKTEGGFDPRSLPRGYKPQSKIEQMILEKDFGIKFVNGVKQ